MAAVGAGVELRRQPADVEPGLRIAGLGRGARDVEADQQVDVRAERVLRRCEPLEIALGPLRLVERARQLAEIAQPLQALAGLVLLGRGRCFEALRGPLQLLVQPVEARGDEVERVDRGSGSSGRSGRGASSRGRRAARTGRRHRARPRPGREARSCPATASARASPIRRAAPAASRRRCCDRGRRRGRERPRSEASPSPARPKDRAGRARARRCGRGGCRPATGGSIRRSDGLRRPRSRSPAPDRDRPSAPRGRSPCRSCRDSAPGAWPSPAGPRFRRAPGGRRGPPSTACSATARARERRPCRRRRARPRRRP